MLAQIEGEYLICEKEYAMAALTIKQIEENNRLEGIRLLTGKTKHHTEVHNVNIIDNPESFEWFTAGDFLLTTGYIFKDDIELQKKLIKELAGLNCSGLGIKIKRYWQEIPKTIIDYAYQYDFPVFEIPFKYSLAHVSNVINDEIFNRESSELKKYKNIYDTFNKISLSGGDLSEITALAADIVGNPIIVVDSRFDLLSYCDCDRNPYPLEQFLSLKMNQRPFDARFNDTIPTDVKLFAVSIKRQVKFDQTEITCRIKPIAYSNTIYGYIIVWETMKKLERLDYIALETAAKTAALERIKLKQIEEARNRQREDFFDDLMEGKILSVNALRNLALNNGINPDKPHIVVAIRVDDLNNGKGNEIIDCLNRYSHNNPFGLQAILRHDNILVFVELTSEQDKNQITDTIRCYIQEMSKHIERIVTSNYAIGVSNLCYDFVTIRKSVMLALDVIKITKASSYSDKIGYFNDLISYHIIDSEINKDVMLTFFEETLGILHTYDLEHDNDLFRTLEVYFECNGNVTQASKVLYIHRNTFVYRLEKIKEILNTNLLNAEENFSYQLAIKIYKILQLKHMNQ
jgi:PucR family transcriptional regulator, purine catabolism regulatory protein